MYGLLFIPYDRGKRGTVIHIEHGAGRCRRDAVLSGAGLGDNPLGSHPLGQQNLADNIVYFMCACVVKLSLIEQLSDSYISWLKQKITFKELDNAVEITTPFMDRHNDYLQIYVQQKGNKLVLSDAGYILTDLKLSGCDVFSSTKRKKILQTILNGYGVKVSSKEELFVETTIEKRNICSCNQ